MAEEVFVLWDLRPAGGGYSAGTSSKKNIFSVTGENCKKEMESLGPWSAENGKGGPAGGVNVYDAKITLISAESKAEAIETVEFLYSGCHGGNTEAALTGLPPGIVSAKRSGSACACAKGSLEFKSV